MRQRAIIAPPMSLMALLLTIARGWQTTQLAENAKKVEEQGRSCIVEQLGQLWLPWRKLVEDWKARTRRTTRWWAAESRVLPTLRRFNELGVAEELPAVKPVESADA